MLNIGKHDPLGGSVRKAIHEWQSGKDMHCDWQGHALQTPCPPNGESKLSWSMQPQKKLLRPS